MKKYIFYILTNIVSAMFAGLFITIALMIGSNVIVNEILQYGLVISILICAMYLTTLQFIKRPCGHGAINQGPFYMKWPFIINICPKCGERFVDVSKV
jgi:hypothetical protein